MRIVAVAFAGLMALGSGSALAGDLAQVAPNIVRADVPVYAAPRYEIASMVRSMGLQPVGTPVRAATTFIQRAVDRAGTMLRVTIDVRSGMVLAVHPVVISPYGAPHRYGMTPTYVAPVYRGRHAYDEPPPYGGPYGYRAPYDGGPYGYRGAYDDGPYRPNASVPPAYDDDDVAVAPPAAPHVRATAPNSRSTALEPPRRPVPKPKPRPTQPVETTAPGAPAQTKPVAAAPQPKPAAPAAPSAPTASQSGSPTFAPLHVP